MRGLYNQEGIVRVARQVGVGTPFAFDGVPTWMKVTRLIYADATLRAAFDGRSDAPAVEKPELPPQPPAH